MSMTPDADEPHRDVDEVAVWRAADGDRSLRLNRHELAAAWRLLERRRLTTLAIAKTLGVAEETVYRWRAGRRPGWRRGSSQYRSDRVTCSWCGEDLARSSLSSHRARRHATGRAA